MAVDQGRMFAAVHGELTVHPWRKPAVASSDAYSLFVARSSAMGWLTPASENAIGGFWGMNDAGQDPSSDPELGSRIAWFQVSLTSSVQGGRPLPLQPFLSCVQDVVNRIGKLSLRAVNVTLPLPNTPSPAGAAGMLVEDSGWFSDGDSRWTTPLRVTLDSGSVPAIGPAAPGILRWLREIRQNLFSCDSLSTAGPHQAVLHGSLAEWSLDALGWLAAFLADASARNGVSVPVQLTAVRLDGRGLVTPASRAP